MNDSDNLLNESNGDKNMQHEHSLLNDSDFLALMEAELAASNTPLDPVSKQLTWNSIETHIDANIKKSDTRRTKHYYSIAATLLILAISLPMLFSNTQTNDIERIKGVDSFISTNLSVYTLNKFGELTLSTGQHKVGTTLLFKVHSSHNGVASIITSKNGHLGSNQFIYTITQDKHGQLLSRQDQVYGYMIEPTDKILQFCVIATNQTAQLQTALHTLSATWSRLDGSACSTINITDSLESNL